MKAPATIRFVAHGLRIAVHSDSAELLEAASPYLPPLRTPLLERRVRRAFQLSTTDSGDGRRFSLTSGTQTLMASPNLRRVLAALEWEVHLFLAQHARDRIFVHAGVVEWNHKALVVPGQSFSGKSTLIAALVRAGCSYLSDEYAIFDASGACHAHPRPMSLRVNGGVEQRTAEDLGGRTTYEPQRLGCVVVTRYRQDATWQPAHLSPGEAAMALLEHAVAARTRSREALAVLRASTEQATGLSSPRGDASEFVHALLSKGL